jgi:hypothetical protein
MTCTMANTWHAQAMPWLTQPELTQLLRVMTSTRDQALLWLAYRHGLRGCLARTYSTERGVGHMCAETIAHV